MERSALHRKLKSLGIGGDRNERMGQILGQDQDENADHEPIAAMG
jgi:hypothetical protein